MMKITRRLACSTLALAAHMAAPAFAQSAADTGRAIEQDIGTGDIIVTARRVAEPLQRTPISVTAFDESRLRNASTTNVGEIGNAVPNLTLAGGRGLASAGFTFIRGVGQTEDNPATDPGVAQYIDDVYIGRTQGTQFDLNDVGTIEILRGPQGTLYGKNAIGGAIKINSKLPDQTPHAYAVAGLGNYSDVRLAAGISQPLVDDKLFARISAQFHGNKGYMENLLSSKNSNNARSFSARGILRYNPDDKLDVYLSADISLDRSRPYEGRIVAINPANAVLKASIAGGMDIRPYLLAPGANPFKGGGFDTPFDPRLPQEKPKNDVGGVSLHFSYDIGGTTFKSITAYRKMDVFRKADTDESPLPYVNNTEPLKQNQFSQELQFSGSTADKRLDWLGGLYYFREHFNDHSYVNYLTKVNPNASFNRFFAQTGKSYAAFLNMGYRLTDDLRISLGGRYTHERKDIQTSTQVLNSTIFAFPLTARSAKFKDFSPKIGLDYQVTPSIFFYASASKGFKSGGFNGRANLAQALAPVGAEQVWSYEAGLKTQAFDRRLTFNLAGFYMDYQDIQEQVFVPRSDGLPGVTSVVLNAAQARIQGLEAEATLRPVRALTFTGSLGYTDAKYSKPFVNNGAIYTNNALPFTSKLTARAGARLAQPLSDSIEGAIVASYSYRSKSYFDVPNSPEIAQKGYGLLDARATLTFDGDFEVAVYGKNLTDKIYRMNGTAYFGSLGFSNAYFGSPRTYGIELSYRM